MSTLERKLVRDLGRLKGQVATIALVLACGIMSLVLMRSTWVSLLDARDAYYDAYRFADVFARLERAPEAVAARLARLRGVAVVETRVVEEIMVPMADEPDPVAGRIVSLPDAGAPQLDDVYLRTGRLPAAGVADEAVILEPFALAHRLAPGDRMPAVINGKLRHLLVVGIAMSPEYVFAMSGREAIPDPRRFVVVWMARGTIARAFDMDGAFDDVTLRLEPGASEPAVLDAVDRELAPYGGRHAVGRDRQMSNYFLTMRLDILRTMALVIPAIFLGVAAFLVNVVVSRLVYLERTQIAVLKAIGFSNVRIGLHYLVLVALIVGLATIAGISAGWWAGSWMSNLYTRFFSFPTRVFRVSPALVATTIGVGLIAAVGGALGAVRRISRMPPAEAMRPPTPLTYRRSLFDRLGLQRALGPAAMMVVREIRRRPLRFAMSTLGIAMGVGIYVMGQFSTDSFDHLMAEVFPREQQQDTTVGFMRPLPPRALHSLEHLPGVLLAEGERVVPARIRVGPHWRDTSITGLSGRSSLRILLDGGERIVDLPESGVVMSRRLAEVLGVVVGDEVEVELLEGDWSHRRAVVAAMIDEAFGMQIYARADWLAGWLGEQPRISVALLRIDALQSAEVAARLKELPAVMSVTSQVQVIARYREQIGSSMLVMTLILTISAAAISTGVVYNNARIALSMRSRDLASLRVLGFTRREISNVLLGELGAQVALGIPLGMWIGKTWSVAMVHSLRSESFQFPLHISPHTYLVAAAIAFFSGLLSALLVRRKLDRLDLVEVLKSATD